MKKFIKSSLLVFTLITAIVMNGCDVFENFQFGLPVSFIIETDLPGTINPSGSQIYCLTENETYNDYADDINNITFISAYIVTQEVQPDSLEGRVTLNLYEYNQGTGRGDSLFAFTTPPIKPAVYDSTNAYKLELTEAQIASVNAYLANSSNKCFEGEYSVEITSGAGVTNYVKIKIDALFNIDAKLE
jgi:hypothetical protein